MNISIWNSSRPKGITDLEWAKSLLNELLDLQIKSEKEKLNKELGTKSLFDLEKMPINVIQLGNYKAFPRGFENSYYGSVQYETESSITSVCERAIREYDSILERCKVEHEANLPAIENNKKIVEGISLMMDKFGIRGSWSEWKYPSSRSRTKKEESVSCQWKSEVLRFVPTNDGLSAIESWHKRMIEEIEKWKIKKLQELTEKVKAREQEEAAKKSSRLLAQLQVKYELNSDTDWKDILETILNKNKYLKLGHALERNRNDWNDGSWFAEQGLSEFNIETESDEEISREIQSLIDNWDDDGRVFRDCNWNYSALYSLVENVKLIEDFDSIKLMME